MAAQLTRRNFGKSVTAAALLLAAGTVPRRADTAGAKYRLRYATAFPADHPGVTQIQEAAAAIAKDAGGLVDLQVFPNSQLGSEPDMFSQVRAGALDMMSTSGVNQTVVPVGGINAIAFAFPSYDKVWAAMDGELGNHVRGKFEKVGLFVMPKMLDNGYRHITSGAKPITSPDDLKGFKIRVPGNQLWVTTFKALGATPTPINFGELYAALQTRVVDGQENPLALINSAKLYEVQKYVAMTGHIWDGHYIFANLARWNGLPEDVRKVMLQHLSEAAERERADILRLNTGLVENLTKAGITFNEPDKQAFRDALKAGGFYGEWKEKFGPEAWGLLEKYAGPL